jgi:uncharacterized membrane protein (DUF373 family)
MRFVFLAAALILAAAIIWAMATASFSASFAKIGNDPWGVVTLIDLYSAFLVSGFVIWRFEPSRLLALALIVLTLGLGSLVPLLWLAFRAGPVLLGARR